MDIDHHIQRLEAVSKERGALKALAEQAGVPYTTALRLVEPGTRPGAIDNLARLISALDKHEASQADRGNGAEAA